MSMLSRLKACVHSKMTYSEDDYLQLSGHLGSSPGDIIGKFFTEPQRLGRALYTALSQAKPDGYTISSLNTPGFLTMQIERKLRFDPLLNLLKFLVQPVGKLLPQIAG